jgi:hypothetical protein
MSFVKKTSPGTDSTCLKRLGVKRRSALRDTSRVYAAIIAKPGSAVSPMWEGPFKVTHIPRPGSARLETAEGILVGNPWNIAHLRKFYP